jgi:nucleotide-binding universal stress UspA family protein
MKTILAPVDFSEVTNAVTDAASLLARAIGARIVILSIVQPPVITSDYSPMVEDIGEIIDAREKAVGRQLTRLATRLKAPSLVVETVRLTGNSTTLILDYAKKNDVDYIIMGSHGHTALYDLIVGSTTHQVLKQATCPVMIVPRPMKKAARRKTKTRRPSKKS